MDFISLFAGIGAFDLALERVGMKCVGQVEIDHSCRRVLKHHWPNVKRRKDARQTKIKAGRAELLCGGFPCQDLSVAGKRAGLAGEQSGLFFEFARIAAEARPRWVLLENVCGLLSSNGGRDMGTVLGALGKLGYGYAFCVLDAQYHGLAQRRKRVFIVGCLGDAACTAKVLFEPESLPGDPPPRRRARQEIAGTLSARAQAGGGLGTDFDCDGGLVVDPVGCCVTAGHGKRYDSETENFVVTHTLRSEGADASEDGTGRGVPLIVVEENVACRVTAGYGRNYNAKTKNLVVFEPRIGRCGRGQPSEVAPALRGAEAGETSDMRPCVAFTQNQREEVRDLGDKSGSLSAEPGSHQQNYVAEQKGGEGLTVVRRLTPL